MEKCYKVDALRNLRHRFPLLVQTAVGAGSVHATNTVTSTVLVVGNSFHGVG